jgi:hypothetical protein
MKHDVTRDASKVFGTLRKLKGARVNLPSSG